MRHLQGNGKLFQRRVLTLSNTWDIEQNTFRPGAIKYFGSILIDGEVDFAISALSLCWLKYGDFGIGNPRNRSKYGYLGYAFQTSF